MNPITRQLIRSSILYASEEMGLALRSSSYSPNIKERMDHSAAIFDAEARLLAQAEHIPVHLGSLPWGLRKIIDYCGREGVELNEGSMVVANNPYIAGTHLNDITVVKPIYFSGALVAYAANKAHHSDVGGRTPGSISPNASSLYEEGLIIDPVLLMDRNEFVPQTISLIAGNTRTRVERLGDLKAQVAANVTGDKRIKEVISKYGLENFVDAAEESFRYAKRLMISRLASMKQGNYKATDFLEHPDGHDVRLEVGVKIRRDHVEVDYTGTDEELANPLNAVYGVTLSGVHYVMRSLMGDDVPANHGTFSTVHVFAPVGTVLNPTFPHPVAAGNVETSQRNADLLFRAFSKVFPSRVPAASGGSMNNVMMGGVSGGENWAFYETIGVGLGGRKGLDGIDGIQANMTNTMNTPIEEIERATPLLVKMYEFRTDSSGAGQFRGGAGIVRTFQALEDSITFTAVSERGRHRPWGLWGGLEGARTVIVCNRKKRRRPKVLPVKFTTVLNEGDTIELRTAGGGGYGDPKTRERRKIEQDLRNGIITNAYVKAYY